MSVGRKSTLTKALRIEAHQRELVLIEDVDQAVVGHGHQVHTQLEWAFRIGTQLVRMDGRIARVPGAIAVPARDPHRIQAPVEVVSWAIATMASAVICPQLIARSARFRAPRFPGV
ncbi:hypothetical protein [Candidatus Palauibacter sp.]|uniref:hypothetical protein n=1 Tax=Candidatus Palauibacter sp. TaxID=3101350 RepID=UPI003B51E054